MSAPVIVPLTSAWARDGLASVTLAALEDAGFHAAIDSDPRGPMHYYGWPLGSLGPITIWVPEDEREEALAFLDAVEELPWEGGREGIERFYWATSRGRRLIYACWALGAPWGTGALAVLGLAFALGVVPLGDGEAA